MLPSDAWLQLDPLPSQAWPAIIGVAPGTLMIVVAPLGTLSPRCLPLARAAASPDDRVKTLSDALVPVSTMAALPPVVPAVTVPVGAAAPQAADVARRSVNADAKSIGFALR